MAKFWKKFIGMFEKEPPAPDPAELAMQRRIKLNGLQSRFSLEVKKQDQFLREYLAQAVEARRTGDTVTLGPIKSHVAMTIAMRRRALRMLHAVRLFATKADQAESYKDFCSVLSEVSSAMGQTLSSADVAKAQQDLQRGLQNAQNADQMMDQMLGMLDATVGEMASGEEESSGVKGADIDAMIAKLAGEKDSAAETRIEDLLAGV